jgi:hypothetical protein
MCSLVCVFSPFPAPQFTALTSGLARCHCAFKGAQAQRKKSKKKGVNLENIMGIQQDKPDFDAVKHERVDYRCMRFVIVIGKERV